MSAPASLAGGIAGGIANMSIIHMKSTFSSQLSTAERRFACRSQMREPIDFRAPHPIVRESRSADGVDGVSMMPNKYLLAAVLAAAALAMYASVFMKFAGP